jgi:hypothetical protein
MPYLTVRDIDIFFDRAGAGSALACDLWLKGRSAPEANPGEIL